IPISGPPVPIWWEIVMIMAHPRRYLSRSAVGAIAIRLPLTSSRTYTSSLSVPLANTSKTSRASSSVVPAGRSCIIRSTASILSLICYSPARIGDSSPGPHAAFCGEVAKSLSQLAGAGKRRRRCHPGACSAGPALLPERDLHEGVVVVGCFGRLVVDQPLVAEEPSLDPAHRDRPGSVRENMTLELPVELLAP